MKPKHNLPFTSLNNSLLHKESFQADHPAPLTWRKTILPLKQVVYFTRECWHQASWFSRHLNYHHAVQVTGNINNNCHFSKSRVLVMKMYKYEKLFNRDVKNLINKNLNVVMETIMFYLHVRTMDHWEFLKLLLTMKSTLV